MVAKKAPETAEWDILLAKNIPLKGGMLIVQAGHQRVSAAILKELEAADKKAVLEKTAVKD